MQVERSIWKAERHRYEAPRRSNYHIGRQAGLQFILAKVTLRRRFATTSSSRRIAMTGSPGHPKEPALVWIRVSCWKKSD